MIVDHGCSIPIMARISPDYRDDGRAYTEIYLLQKLQFCKRNAAGQGGLPGRSGRVRILPGVHYAERNGVLALFVSAVVP